MAEGPSNRCWVPPCPAGFLLPRHTCRAAIVCSVIMVAATGLATIPLPRSAAAATVVPATTVTTTDVVACAPTDPACWASPTAPGPDSDPAYDPSTVPSVSAPQPADAATGMVAVLNDARATESLKPIADTDDDVLAPDSSGTLFSLLNEERTSRDLPAGIPTNRFAGPLAVDAQDAIDPSAADVTDQGVVTWRGLWGRGSAPDVTAQLTYEFVYDDGWNGSVAATPNLACIGPDAPGCGAHRAAVLMANPPNTVLEIDVAEASIDVGGTAEQSFSVVLAWVRTEQAIPLLTTVVQPRTSPPMGVLGPGGCGDGSLCPGDFRWSLPLANAEHLFGGFFASRPRAPRDPSETTGSRRHRREAPHVDG